MPSDLDPIFDSDEQDLDSGSTAQSSIGSRLPARLFRPLVLALLAAIAVLLLVNLAAVRTLTRETKRSACYERLSFIGRPEEAQVPGAARLCEGPRPVVEYSEE